MGKMVKWRLKVGRCEERSLSIVMLGSMMKVLYIVVKGCK